MEKYNVVVVGGSCAGAAAGTTLAKGGKNTLIIDKAAFPRQKLCAGMITEKTIQLLHNIYGVSCESVIDSTYHGFGVYHARLGRVSSYCAERHTLAMVHRDGFDHFFLQEARKAGCSILTGDPVEGIRNGRIHTASGKEIAADIVIGADGAYSVIGKTLPRRRRRDASVYIGLETDIAYDNLRFYSPSEVVIPWVCFGYVEKGYGWIFPKRDFATVGIAGPAKQNDKKLLGAFTSFLSDICEGGMPSREKVRGHRVPVNNIFEEPGFNNILLVGDAARLVEPLTGEGIYFAALSGNLAGLAVIMNPKDPARAYNRFLKRHVRGLFRQARFAKALYYTRWLNIYAMNKMARNAKWCKYFLALLSGEIDYIRYFTFILKDRTVYPPMQGDM